MKNAKRIKSKLSKFINKQKLLMKNTGAGFFFVAKVVAFIVMISPYIPYIISMGASALVIIEFIVSIIVDVLSTVICSLASKLVGLLPVGGFILGWSVSWLLGKLFAYIFPDSKKKSIADYLYTQLPRIKSFNDWVCVFGEALNV